MRKSQISKIKQSKLIELFAAGSTARCAAVLVGVNTRTAAYYFRRLREIIANHLEQESLEVFDGEIELDESYFGGTRKGQRGKGASGKVAVFGILKRQGKVYTKMVQDTKTKTLLPIIKGKIQPDSIVYTDNYRSYHALDVSEFHHLRINHYKEFVDTKNKRNHINGIENFWNQAKRHMRKFNGVPKEQFQLFLKECFNNPNPKSQISLLNQWIKALLKYLSGSAPSLFFYAGIYMTNKHHLKIIY